MKEQSTSYSFSVNDLASNWSEIRQLRTLFVGRLQQAVEIFSFSKLCTNFLKVQTSHLVGLDSMKRSNYQAFHL